MVPGRRMEDGRAILRIDVLSSGLKSKKPVAEAMVEEKNGLCGVM